MFNLIRACSALVLAVSLPALAAETPRIVEEAYETTTDATALPASANGTVSVRTCVDCAPLLMTIDAGARFKVGRSPVTFAELSSYLKNAPGRNLVVFYDTQRRVVTGVKVQGQLDNAKGTTRKARKS